ncbi:MAG TPA: hypothetical protein VD886_15020, partial [Herpetosiphonaceae bacterium]|nr:hypothetical protein [Herpetosiphonaceae bacterium]
MAAATKIAPAADRPNALKSLLRERGLLVIALLWLALLPAGLFRIYATDEVQYFAYLHSVYFDGDLDFANEYRHFAAQGERVSDTAVYAALLKPNEYDPPLNAKTGKYRNVAPVGSAMLWSPFYVLADGLVRLGNALGGATPADGYSQPYLTAVCVGAAFYTLLGLILSYRLARRWVGGWAATLATLAMWLATPLIWYTYVQMPWSHSAGFAMVALFITIWLGREPAMAWDERCRRRSLGGWLALAVVGGLMTLVREQLGLFLLLPAIEGLAVYWRSLGARDWPAARALLLRHAMFLIVFALMLAPQLVAYQILYGQPRPSGTVSGKLSLISYHFFEALFDPRRGALLWTPIWALALLGFGLLWRRDRFLALALGAALLAQPYINGAISTWHLSGSFGFRRLIECTPLFVIGLALLIERLRWPRPAVAALILAFVLWN